jgi:hypothetical protein
MRKAEPLHARDLLRGIVTAFPLNVYSVISAYTIITVDLAGADGENNSAVSIET